MNSLTMAQVFCQSVNSLSKKDRYRNYVVLPSTGFFSVQIMPFSPLVVKSVFTLIMKSYSLCFIIFGAKNRFWLVIFTKFSADHLKRFSGMNLQTCAKC